MSNTVLEARDLCKTYIVDKFSNNVLQNVNLKITEGEFVTVMGPSGSGKSTLLYTVSGMDSITSGSAFFDGEDITKASEKELTKIRLVKMGFVFQQMYMMKKLCIMDNIVLPAYQAKLKSRSDVDKDATALMRRLGIVDTAQREITEVSGGQLQRACLCRALINDPKTGDETDFLVIESTYGNRLHKNQDVMESIKELAGYIQKTLDRKGTVVIPSFAVGRTQELLYAIREIKQPNAYFNNNPMLFSNV